MRRRAILRRSGSLAAFAALAAGALALVLDDRPLTVPVRGLRPERIVSTFGAPRDGGRRRHHGVDLFAPRGTPVVAAQTGVVVWVGVLSLGGRVVATVGRRGVVCYYAHLDRWAPGLAVGDWVDEGEPLGTVGNTGNARTTPPHLHFATYALSHAGLPVDPGPLLGARAAPSPWRVAGASIRARPSPRASSAARRGLR